MSHFFIVSGESSGDRLGALLGGELLVQGHQVSGWGGQHMQKAGINITQDIAELKVMGWTDVIFSLPKYFNLLSKCKRDISAISPDAIILIDFGTFNLKVAKWAKNNRIKVIYYSPPKIWASRASRITQLKKYCDQVIVLFPFEKSYYENKGLEVEYFGHPLAEQIKSFQPDPIFWTFHGLDERPILSILPGSRSSEIKNTLPIYLDAISDMTEYQVCVSCAEGQEVIIRNICESAETTVTVVSNAFYDLLANTDIALVTSGSATLEAALFNIPQVVGYKTSLLNYTIAKSIITTKYISLVNLVADKKVVVELIQGSLNAKSIKKEVSQLKDIQSRKIILENYKEIVTQVYNLGGIQKKVDAISN